MWGFGGEPRVVWSSVDVVVVRVVVELYNGNGVPVYYVTNAFCGGLRLEVNGSRVLLVDGSIREPIDMPRLHVHKGAVFPVPRTCTLDLRYRGVLPGDSVENVFYYIVTVPFEGVVEASATVCRQPLCSGCPVVEGSVEVVIGGG